MSSKAPLPVLNGQRLKSRKRDMKEKYDPEAFRDEIVAGLLEAEGSFEKAYKFLDSTGSSLDYRRYAECLFDTLIAGGLLAPGGSLVSEAPEDINPLAVLQMPDNLEDQQKHAYLVRDVLRRYKYLLVSLEEEIGKVLKFIKAYDAENVNKLAKMTGLYLHFSLISAKPLEALLTDAVVKTGLAKTFIMEVFATWYAQPNANVSMVLRRTGIEGRLLEFLPHGERTQEAFVAACQEKGGLDELIKLQSVQGVINARRSLKKHVLELFEDEADIDDILSEVTAAAAAAEIPEADSAVLVLDAIVSTTDMAKKSDQLQEHVLRQMHTYLELLGAFCTRHRSQVALLNSLQGLCYENQALLKLFPKFCMLLYKGEVVEEDAILSWYNKDHSSKGRNIFLESMKEMVDWLQSAEEEQEEV